MVLIDMVYNHFLGNQEYILTVSLLFYSVKGLCWQQGLMMVMPEYGAQKVY